MGKGRYEMVGYAKRTLMCIIDKKGAMHVNQHKFNQNIVEKETYAKMDNVCYPFKYFTALQSCDEQEYSLLSRDL